MFHFYVPFRCVSTYVCTPSYLFSCQNAGAGKTTLISVLTGLYEPTSGSARIAGYDLTTQISAIHHHLGVCPQFDIHHAQLTAEEHLLFYARLKGVRRNKERLVVERALRQVLVQIVWWGVYCIGGLLDRYLYSGREGLLHMYCGGEGS